MVRNGYNQTSFKRRFQMVSIRLARARRLGHNPWFVLFNNPHYFTQLLPERPLDGLSLYRQSAAKLTIPKQILTAQTRTIMVISHC